MSQVPDSQASWTSTAERTTPMDSRPEEVGPATPCHNIPQSGRPPTAAAPRPVRRNSPGTRWMTTDVSLLIGFKRGEAEKQLLGGAREKMKTATQRWAEIKEDFAKHGMDRTPEQIRSKWEKLTVEFKKVFDYQIAKPSGQPGYFEMDSAQRKQFDLPGNFDQELHNLLDCWYPNQRAVNPDRANLMDSSTIHLEEENPDANNSQHPDANNSQHSEADDINITGNEENNRPILNAANITPLPDEHGRRKKTRRDRLDQHFSSANKSMLDAMAVENEKRALNDEAVLEWEKERLQTQVATELQMHEKELAVRTHIGDQVAAALRDVAKSFADFTSVIAKKSG